MAHFPHQIPQIPRDPYIGPPMLTSTRMPAELRIKIFSYLHAPGDGKWTDKNDLKAINSVRHPQLCPAVREELFRCMLLKFRYEGAFDQRKWWSWETPKLLQMVEAMHSLRDLVKEVRVHVIPVSQKKGRVKLLASGLGRVTDPSCLAYLEKWEQRLFTGAAVKDDDPTWGFVDELNSATHPDQENADLGVEQDDLFYHMFATILVNPDQERQQLFASSELTPTDYAEASWDAFAHYVLSSIRHRILPKLDKIEHMEAGMWSQPAEWSKRNYISALQQGLAFASALVLKTAPLKKTTSLRFHGLPVITWTESMGVGAPEEIARFGIRNIAARLQHFGHHLTNLDLSIDYTTHWPIKPWDWETNPVEQQRWPDQITFWAKMLLNLRNLKNLRLHDARERYEQRDEQNLDLNMLFGLIKLPSVHVLHLSSWAVTPEILTDKLGESFPELKCLDLENLDMRSADENAWAMVLAMIKTHFQQIKIGPLVGLRHRFLKGKEVAYVKANLKRHLIVEEQVEDVWNKLANKVGKD